jgi:hypothetical protein
LSSIFHSRSGATGFICYECRRPANGQPSYHCRLCDYDAHAQCVSDSKIKVGASTTSVSSGTSTKLRVGDDGETLYCGRLGYYPSSSRCACGECDGVCGPYGMVSLLFLSIAHTLQMSPSP